MKEKDISDNLINIENFFLNNIQLNNEYPPLFVIGTPRSGSTLIFLHILNNLKFGFIPNISKSNPYAPISYALKIKDINYLPTLDNHYGLLKGDEAPSDGWDIFNRFFPKYDLSIPVKEKELFKIKNIYYFLEKVYNAPIANKNISDSIRISYLDKLFPDSYFIWIERDLCDTVISILEARKEHNTKFNHWWCTPPPQFYDKEFNSELERVVYQVFGIKNSIELSLGKINKDRWLKVEYINFCEDPEKILSWVKSKYDYIEMREKSLKINSYNHSKKNSDIDKKLKKQINDILINI